jgi:hypothetical protein
MLLSRHQNAGQNHVVKLDDRFFENVAQLKHFGTTVTDKNLIQEEIRVMLDTIPCITFKSYSLLFKNIKIRIYKNLILPVVLYGCETWS